MGKEARLTMCDVLQPKMRSSLPPSQSFIFPGGPPGKNIVQGLEDWVKGRLIEATVVVNPSPDHGIGYPGQIVQGLVRLPMHAPLPHGFAYRFCRLIADGRTKTDKESTPAVLRPPRLKRIAQEIEFLLRITPSPIIILTVDDLGLL